MDTDMETEAGKKIAQPPLLVFWGESASRLFDHNETGVQHPQV